MIKSKIYTLISYFVNINYKSESIYICPAFLLVENNKQFDVLLVFSQCIAFVFYIALIMLLMLLAC